MIKRKQVIKEIRKNALNIPGINYSEERKDEQFLKCFLYVPTPEGLDSIQGFLADNYPTASAEIIASVVVNGGVGMVRESLVFRFPYSDFE